MLPEGRVLVVDDEPAIRALVKKIVERTGLAVDSAVDGVDAIEKLSNARYDVMVLDLMMPNLNGYDVVDHIRNGPSPRPAVIVITAASESISVLRLDSAIVHSVVRKPFDITVLGDLVTATVASVIAARAEEEADNVVKFPGKGTSEFG